MNRLSEDLKPRRRIVRHGLFWVVVFLILISGTSLLLSTKPPVTADVSIMNRYERSAAEPGPVDRKESVATVVSERVVDPEIEKPSEKASDANGEKRTALRHVVQSGDTLSSIAREYKTSIDAIIRENNLQNHLIYIGQILKIAPSGVEKIAPNAG